MRIRLPVSRLFAVALFAALCAIGAGWALQLFAPKAPIAPGAALVQGQQGLDVALASQLFGGVPRAQPTSQAAAPSNIQVTGVVDAGERGVALLAIDGRPAKPFAVGDTLDGGLKVVSVTLDGVGLTRGDQPIRLPAPTRSSLDVLTRGPAPGGAAETPPVSQAVGPGVPRAQPLAARPLPPAGAAALPQSAPPQVTQPGEGRPPRADLSPSGGQPGTDSQ